LGAWRLIAEGNIMTDGNFFRRSVYQIDIRPQDAAGHLAELKISIDMQLVMDYFMYFLFVDNSKLGNNEFSIRHQQIKDGILAIMNKRYDSGSQLISSCIEGMVKESLLNDGCIDNNLPYPNWTGTFHEHPQPRNFFQFFEGALQDPRSRIGRTTRYLSEEEIYHVSEMIRNPLAHGARTAAILQDYISLYFILILLYHDIVNPHNYKLNDKYRSWIYYTMRNMRLAGTTPTLDDVLVAASEKNLALDLVRANYDSVS
jgi:hypothetical protein